MAQTVTSDDLTGDPNRRVSSLFTAHFPLLRDGLGLAKSHAFGADTFASKIKALSHIRQFHAPAMILARRCTAVELGSAFITCEFLHANLSFLLFES